MGYDAGKKVKGRKIHALVVTLGLPIHLVVHSAAVQDRNGAALLLDKVRKRFPWLECVFADGGYDSQHTYEAAAANHPLLLEVVRRNPHAVGLEVIKRRWIVERTFPGSDATAASPRTTKTLPPPYLSFVTLATIQFGVRRLARK